jgi:altronate dehydratase small subunit
MLNALVVDPKDNVANLVGPGTRGAGVSCRLEGREDAVNVDLCEDVPANHKFAFTDIKAGDPIVKYGLVIGTASVDIAIGAHVHVHNIESNRGRGDLASFEK